MAERIRYLVHGGTVQGVNFRNATAKVGTHLNLVGYVKNVKNAEKVEGEAQGDATAIKEFLKFINDGPRMATVVKVESTKMEPRSDTTDPAIEREFKSDRS